MRRKREVFPNPGYPKTRGKYLIQVLRQDAPPELLPTNRKIDRRRVIKLLGLAARSFRWAAGKFGRRQLGTGPSIAKRYAKGYWRTQGRAWHANITSYLAYIDAAFPGLVDTSMRRGLASFIREFDRDWATALKEGRN
jgi:hypothetical protein